MRSRLIAVSLTVGLILPMQASLAGANRSAAVSKNWQALTRTDVQAAYELLKDNHPGALRETGDPAFRAALKAGYRQALAHAAAVTGYGGYLATLGDFAGEMGDGHIVSRPLYKPVVVRWAGLIAAKRGHVWVVAKEDRKVVATTLVGARFVSCGGIPIEKWAHAVLRFHTAASVSAMQVVFGRWLLLDDGNPFVTWPGSCAFEQHGARKIVALHWTKVHSRTLEKNYTVSTYGKAGFGVSRWHHGYWIAMQQLWYKAGPVIAAARKRERDIRASPFVVVDLRGNGGGDDSYGRHLADAIYGTAHVDAALGPAGAASGGCDEVFRASAGNIAAETRFAAEFSRLGDTTGASAYRVAVRQMKAARAAGRVLTGAPVCKGRGARRRASKPLMTGRVIVLTDSLCFSSCINTVGFFRKLGATQVGVETGADTHYAEYRQITLPSGLSTFSTLQAIMPEAPLHIGPYAPKAEFTYAGDIADTAAVRHWISSVVLPAVTHRR